MSWHERQCSLNSLTAEDWKAIPLDAAPTTTTTTSTVRLMLQKDWLIVYVSLFAYYVYTCNCLLGTWMSSSLVRHAFPQFITCAIISSQE